ncbi:MAG TPA: glycosyltransferase family 4 protein [Thermoplasmata archaeon]|nr:glycosyltransferase family 4 protein [Thermoplasmata archaeon]
MEVELITPDADPNHGGFGARVHGIVSMFAEFADVRVVLTDWTGGPRLPRVTYETLPIRDSWRTRVRRLGSYFREDFPRRTDAEPPDLVVVASLDRLGLNQYGDDVPMILDEHNVYWNLLPYEIVNAPFFRTWPGRRAAVREWLVPRLLERAKRFEMAALRKAARVLATSAADRRQILQECPDLAPRVSVLPNCVDTRRIRALPDPTGSRDVVFVGDHNYVPNQEADAFIVRELAPAFPDVRFLLVGSNRSAGPFGPNVFATGHVPDLLGLLRNAAVCIAPLSHGSGTRLKILTYLAAARAVVATTKACEGLPVEDGRHLLIRDDPAEFRRAVGRLLRDAQARRDLGAAGRDLVEAQLDWRVHVPRLRAVCEEAIAEAGTPALGPSASGAHGPIGSRRTPAGSSSLRRG